MHYLLPKKKKHLFTLSIHPQATSAFFFSQKLHRIFDSTKLYPAASSLIPEYQTLHAIITESSELALISGFEHTNFDLTNGDHMNSNIFIYSADLPTSEIEAMAWNGVTQMLLSSIRSNSLGQLYNDINELMPSHIINDLFGKPRLSEQKLADMTSVGRTTISKQRYNIKRSRRPKPQVETSIFDFLTKGAY